MHFGDIAYGIIRVQGIKDSRKLKFPGINVPRELKVLFLICQFLRCIEQQKL